MEDAQTHLIMQDTSLGRRWKLDWSHASDCPLSICMMELAAIPFVCLRHLQRLPLYTPYTMPCHNPCLSVSESSHHKLLTGRAELEAQLREQEARKKGERRQRLLDDLRMAQEAEAYNPWGRGGCGAPLRSSSGRAIADLTEVQGMHVPSAVIVCLILGRKHLVVPVLERASYYGLHVQLCASARAKPSYISLMCRVCMCPLKSYPAHLICFS